MTILLAVLLLLRRAKGFELTRLGMEEGGKQVTVVDYD